MTHLLIAFSLPRTQKKIIAYDEFVNMNKTDSDEPFKKN